MRAYDSVAMLILYSGAKSQSVSDRLHELVSNHLAKLCALPSAVHSSGGFYGFNERARHPLVL
jgi:hypothetical protein